MKPLRWLLLASALVFTTAGSCDDGRRLPGDAGSGGDRGGSGGTGAGGSAGQTGGSGGTGGTGGSGGSAGSGTAGAGGSGGSGGTGVEPSCDAPAALAIPSTTPQSIAAGGVTCLTLDLAARQAVNIEPRGISRAVGTVRLRAPGGDVIASPGYGFGSGGTGRIRLGVAAAGTYRLEITNAGAQDGEIGELAVEVLTPELLAVPGSATFTVPPSKSELYMVKPEPGQTFAARISQATGTGEIGFRNDPTGSSILASGTLPRALVHRAHPAVLPVYEVFRNRGTGDEPVTFATEVPDSLSFDHEVTLTSLQPGELLVLTFEGTAGDAWSSGVAYDLGRKVSPSLAVTAPDGTSADGIDRLVSQRVRTFAMSGPFTVEIRNTSGIAGEPFQVRINHVGAPEPMPAGERFEVTQDLALGEVRRWSLDVTQGQVFALELAARTMLDMTSTLEGGGAYDAFLDVSAGPAPRIGVGYATYVQKSAPAIFSVFSDGRYTDRASGQLTSVFKRPDPEPLSVGSRITGTAAGHELLAWSLDVGADQRHRMCWSYDGALQNGFATVRMNVWGPSAPFVNYSAGDIASDATATSGDEGGVLRAGTNTLSLLNLGAGPAPFMVRIAAIEDPVALVPGAAATSGAVGPCERDYFELTATKDAAYTLRATASFDGEVRGYRLAPNGDVMADALEIAGFPQPLASGVERVVAFTADATATYVIQLHANAEASGTYDVRLTTP